MRLYLKKPNLFFILRMFLTLMTLAFFHSLEMVQMPRKEGGSHAGLGHSPLLDSPWGSILDWQCGPQDG